MILKEVELLRTKILLVVEDEHYLQHILTETFDKLDIKYHACSNGLEAIEIVNNNNIDLILTDIDMPEMNGIELINTLHDKDIFIPTILMSAHTEPEYRTLAKSYNNIFFTQKPFDFMKFLEIVYRIFKN